MKKPPTYSIVVVLLAILIVGGLSFNRSLKYVHGASEDSYGLWMALLKGFDGPVYYVGSEGDFSYFRAGKLIYSRYRVPTAKTRLPTTFPFGEHEPYLVSHEMYPSY
jgi:hypothetical protein